MHGKTRREGKQRREGQGDVCTGRDGGTEVDAVREGTLDELGGNGETEARRR